RAGSPAPMAGLSVSRAIVGVGPPLSFRPLGSSCGSPVIESVRPPVILPSGLPLPSSTRLWLPLMVIRVNLWSAIYREMSAASLEVLWATIVLSIVMVLREVIWMLTELPQMVQLVIVAVLTWMLTPTPVLPTMVQFVTLASADDSSVTLWMPSPV